MIACSWRCQLKWAINRSMEARLYQGNKTNLLTCLHQIKSNWTSHIIYHRPSLTFIWLLCPLICHLKNIFKLEPHVDKSNDEYSRCYWLFYIFKIASQMLIPVASHTNCPFQIFPLRGLCWLLVALKRCNAKLYPKRKRYISWQIGNSQFDCRISVLFTSRCRWTVT